MHLQLLCCNQKEMACGAVETFNSIYAFIDITRGVGIGLKPDRFQHIRNEHAIPKSLNSFIFKYTELQLSF